MTTPDERERARIAAEEALARAQEMKEHGESLAEQWRQTRTQNNFRRMLRSLARS